MTDEQKQAVRCAFADLCGAMQGYLQMDILSHDWAAHYRTIEELAQAFDFLDPIPDDLQDF